MGRSNGYRVYLLSAAVATGQSGTTVAHGRANRAPVSHRSHDDSVGAALEDLDVLEGIGPHPTTT